MSLDLQVKRSWEQVAMQSSYNSFAKRLLKRNTKTVDYQIIGYACFFFF